MRVPIKTEELEGWRRRLERSARRLEDEGHLDKWRKIRNAYRGVAENQEDGVSNDIQYILSSANAILPTIVAQDPFVHVRPRKEDSKGSASTQQAAINWVWKRTRTTSKVRDQALYSLLYGIGVLRAEYDSHDFTQPHYDTGPEQKPPDDDTLTPEQRADLMDAASMVSFVDDPDDMPRCRLVQPWCLLVPDGFSELNEMDWVAEMHLFRPEDLRHDYMGRFRVPKGLKATHTRTSGIPTKVDKAGLKRGEAEYVAVYEIHYWRRDRRKRGQLQRMKLWLLADHGDLTESVLLHEKDESPVVGYPYTVLRFARDPSDFYATHVADLQSIMTITEQLNDSIRYMINHHKQQRVRLYLAAKDIIDDEAVAEGIRDGQDGDVIAIDTGGRALGEVFSILPEAAPSSETSYLLSILEKLVLEISGVGVLQRGGTLKKGGTATEASIANQGFQSRSAIRLDAVDQVIEDLASMYLAFLRRFWEEPRYIRVVGEDAFVEFNSADIEGNYDVEIVSGSTLPTDPATEQQALMGLSQFIVQNMQAIQALGASGVVPPDQVAALAQEMLREAFSAFRMDQKSLRGALAQLAGTGVAKAASAAANSPMGGQPIEGNGDDGGGASLAGSGPRGGGPGVIPLMRP